uniref:Uncharacterized protein n=1 Tax=Amphimedon queenslandica TaxID=400682 RepID=A0A1X7ULH4_AMPQE
MRLLMITLHSLLKELYMVYWPFHKQTWYLAIYKHGQLWANGHVNECVHVVLKQI